MDFQNGAPLFTAVDFGILLVFFSLKDFAPAIETLFSKW